MSDQASKSIKIKFEIDQSSFDRVKGQILELGNAISKVAELNQRAFGGAGGGGVAASIISGKGPLTPGGQAAGGGGNKGGVFGVSADAVSQALAANVKVLKGSANEGKDSLKVISDATKHAIDAQIQYIEKLETKLKNVNNLYSTLRPGGMLSKSDVQVEALGAAGQIANAKDKLAAMGGRMPPTGFWGKAAAFLGLGGIGGGGAGGGAGGAAAGGGGGVGGMIGALGGLGGLGQMAIPAALAAAAIKAGNAANQNAMTSVDYYLNKDAAANNIMSNIGGQYGGLFKTLRGGSLSTALALKRAKTSGQWWLPDADSADKDGLIRGSVMAGQIDRVQGERGTLGGAFSRAWGWAGAKLQPGSYKESFGGMTEQEIAKNRAFMSAPETITANKMAALAYAKNGPLTQIETQQLDRIEESMPGYLSMQRSGNLSFKGAAHLAAMAEENNMDAGGIISGMLQARSAAGYGYTGRGVGLYRAGLAGMGNASQALGMGSQYDTGTTYGRGRLNAGNTSSLYQALIGSTGRNKLDETAANSLAGIVSKSLPEFGNFHGDAANIYNMLSPMVAGGTGGQQLFKAGTLGAGMGMMAKDAAGIDANARGARWGAIASGTAELGLGPTAALALQNFALNPNNRIDLAKGTLPKALSDAGFKSVGDVQRILGQSDRSLLGNVLRTNEKTSNQTLLHSIDAAGGIDEWMKTNKMTPEIARQLGSMRAASSNGAITEREAEGEFDILGGLNAPGKGITGGHIRAGGSMSAAEKAKQRLKGENIREDADTALKRDKEFAQLIATSKEESKKIQAEMTEGFGTAIAGAQNLGTALDALAKHIKEKFHLDIDFANKPKATPTRKAGPKTSNQKAQDHIDRTTMNKF